MNGELEELSEKEKEQRKNDQIAYRKKQSASNLFLFVGTICEIIIALAIIVVFFLLSVLLLSRVFHFSEEATSLLFNIFLAIDFIGGLACGFFVYRALGRWLIRKWNLHEKLREDVLNHFKTRKEYKEYYEKKKQR